MNGASKLWSQDMNRTELESTIAATIKNELGINVDLMVVGGGIDICCAVEYAESVKTLLAQTGKISLHVENDWTGDSDFGDMPYQISYLFK